MLQKLHAPITPLLPLLPLLVESVKLRLPKPSIDREKGSVAEIEHEEETERREGNRATGR